MQIFPPTRTHAFFEALFGDAEEGAFNIILRFVRHDASQNSLLFELQLKERPGRCLSCNLTYGLPEVFSRHPVINLAGMVKDIEDRLDGAARCVSWSLGHTRTLSKDLHAIPLVIALS